MSDNANVSVSPQQYAWLRPAWPAPQNICEYCIVSPSELADVLEALPPQPISFDTETPGLRYWVLPFFAKSVAVYVPSERLSYVTHFLDFGDEIYPPEGGTTYGPRLPPQTLARLVRAFARHRLYAFNLQFDGGVLYALNESLPRKLRMDGEALLAAFAGCSQVFFRHAANERKQSHSLETAQANLFGWEDSQKTWLATALEAKGLTKDNMWRLLEHEDTREGFLYYNAMDARSAWLLWEHFCSEARRVERAGMIDLHEQEFATLRRDCIRQVFEGMPLDRKGMRKILIDAYKARARAYTALRSHPDITPFIEAWEAKRIAELWRLDIERKSKKMADSRIVSEALADYGVEDVEVEDEAELDESVKCIKTKEGPPEMVDDTCVTPLFQIKFTTKKGWGNKFPGFNFGSPDHLQELLYGHLAKAELAYMKKLGEDELPRYKVTFRGKEFLIGCTDSGGLPTGAEVYPIFGEIGRLLEAAAEADTRYGFAKSYLAAASETGKIHTQLKVHGAGTGRCSGGSGDENKKKKNLSVSPHQLPRTDKEFMECFKAPKGWVYLSNDFKGLEKVVQAELSGDPVLAQLYASGLPHDVHLFHTARIHPNAAMRAALMERYVPDAAVVKALKKEFKTERDQGKAYGFSLDYNSGAESIMLKSFTQGSPISLEEAEAIRSNYRDIYKVYYQWCEGHKEEWKARGGWIEDGFGFPIAIDPASRVDYKGFPSSLRESGSKIVQRTGHYILLVWLKHIEAIKRERRLWDLERPVICDLHDERIVLTPESRVEECLALHSEALCRTNDELQPKIRFEIASEYGPTLYDCKRG